MNMRIFERSPHNPIITPRDLPFPAASVLNPGATVQGDQVVLLLRVEDTAGYSSIYVARSRNGVTDWRFEPEPILRYGQRQWRCERWGCEDARVTYLATEERWYITYTAYSENGAAVALARSEDLVRAERVGLIFSPNNKDAALFPKKFGGDIQKHYEILTQELADVHGKQVLELATGSGSAVYFLNSDNQFTGTDISAGLLRQAKKRFEKAGFSEPVFYVVSAEDLPFEDGSFDLCLCILALNFVQDVKIVFQEAARVLVPGGVLVCSVPVPERNHLQSTINGTLYSEEELEEISQENGFAFEQISGENGALLYFRAIK